MSFDVIIIFSHNCLPYDMILYVVGIFLFTLTFNVTFLAYCLSIFPKLGALFVATGAGFNCRFQILADGQILMTSDDVAESRHFSRRVQHDVGH